MPVNTATDLMISKLLRAYMGESGTTVNGIAREIGINGESLMKLVNPETGNMGYPEVTVKIILWLFSGEVREPTPTNQPVPSTTTVIPVKDLSEMPESAPQTKPRHEPREATLSPRMKKLAMPNRGKE